MATPGQNASSASLNPQGPSPEYQFNGPEDKPDGVVYSASPDGGFVASARAAQFFPAIVFLGLLTFLVYLLLHADGNPNRPPTAGYFIVLGIAASLAAVLAIFYLFGREGIEVDRSHLHVRKMLFGRGLRRSIPLAAIRRVAITMAVPKAISHRSTGPQYVPGGGTMFLRFGSRKYAHLIVETADEIYRVGGSLGPDKLYYFRYLTLCHIMKMRGIPIPPTAA